MAATLVQSKTGASNTANSTVTVTWDTPATAGNLLIIVAGCDAYKRTQSNGTPTGFTIVSPAADTETYLGHYMWYKVASGGETSATFVLQAAATWCWFTGEWSGVSTFDLGSGAFAQSAGLTYTTPSITPTSGDRLLVASIGGSISTTNPSGVESWLNSFVEIGDASTNLASGTRDTVGVATLSVTANGSTAYSSGATYSGAVTMQARTGIIASFAVSSGGASHVADGSRSITATRSASATTGKTVTGSLSVTATLSAGLTVSAAPKTLDGSLGVTATLAASLASAKSASASLGITASRSVTAAAGEGNFYRIWPSTDGPLTDAADPNPYTLSVGFTVSQDAWVTKLHYFRGTTDIERAVQGAIFNNATLAQVGPTVTFTESSSTPPDWHPVFGAAVTDTTTSTTQTVWNAHVTDCGPDYPGCRRLYDGNTGWPSSYATTAGGATVFTDAEKSWKWISYKLDINDLGSGALDAGAAAYFDTFPEPVPGIKYLLTLHHEFEDEIGTTGTAAEWKTASYKFGQLVRAQGRDDFLNGPCFMSLFTMDNVNLLWAAGTEDLNDVIDFVGWDPYNEDSKSIPATYGAAYQGAAGAAYYLTDITVWTQNNAPGKHICLGEIGFVPDETDLTKRPAYLNAVEQFAIDQRFLVVCYFDAIIVGSDSWLLRQYQTTRGDTGTLATDQPSIDAWAAIYSRHPLSYQGYGG